MTNLRFFSRGCSVGWLGEMRCGGAGAADEVRHTLTHGGEAGRVDRAGEDDVAVVGQAGCVGKAATEYGDTGERPLAGGVGVEAEEAGERRPSMNCVEDCSSAFNERSQSLSPPR